MVRGQLRGRDGRAPHPAAPCWADSCINRVGPKKSRLEELGYSCLSSLVVSSQLQLRSSVRRIQLKAFCDIKEFFTCSEQDVKASTLLIG